jgi:hypothetical protein
MQCSWAERKLLAWQLAPILERIHARSLAVVETHAILEFKLVNTNILPQVIACGWRPRGRIPMLIIPSAIPMETELEVRHVWPEALAASQNCWATTNGEQL